METIRTTRIGSTTFVSGFDQQVQDPVASKKKTALELKTTEEALAIEEVFSQLSPIVEEQERSALALSLAKDAAEAADIEEHLEMLNKRYKLLVKELRQAQKAYKKMAKDLLASNVVFFHLRRNEVEVPPEELKSLKRQFKRLERGQRLTVDGDIVTDRTGDRYWLRTDDEWSQHVIKNITEEIPEAGIFDAELTPGQKVLISEQQESNRILDMADGDRELELSAQLESAAARAASFRSVLEIQGGDPTDALDQAQKKYKHAKKALTKKYKVVK